MKKLIGVIGAVAIAMGMFFSTNMLNSSNGSLDLASIIDLNTANAEEVVCSVSKSNGEVIMTCSTSDTSCSETKWGYTLSCNKAKLDE